MRSPLKSDCRQSGSVILLVLGMVMFVAALLTRFVLQVGTDLIVASRTSDESALRREAYSALETSLAVLAEVQATDGGLYAPEQGWRDPLAYAGRSPPAGITVEVNFTDETGKLSLPTASSGALLRVFEYAGIEPNRAQQAADALLAWLHPVAAGAGPVPADRTLRSFADLGSIPGLRDALADPQRHISSALTKVSDALSLHRLNSVNLNSASPAALYALGWTSDRIAALEQARAVVARSGFARKVEDLVALSDNDAANAALGTKIEALRIKVTAHRADAVYTIEAVAAPLLAPATGSVTAGNPDHSLHYPFRILEFQENADANRLPPSVP